MYNQLNQPDSTLLKGTLPTINVIGSPVTALPFADQIEVLLKWAQARLSKAVCVANTHMLIEAHWHDAFGDVLAKADLVTPDGMPLVWMLKLMGVRRQNRVAGMDLFLALCQAAPSRDVSIFLLGSQTSVLEQMRVRLVQEFPGLKIAGMEPLPFRPLTPEEDEALVERVNASGAGLLFLALGCPKQETWIARHKGRIQAAMVGVGGVFPVYAGIQKRAPAWIREGGLEWCYRLIQEPKRLWKRYGTTIPLFVWLAAKQLWQRWVGQDTVVDFRVRRSQI